jgi:hypothetical protein
MKTGAKIAIGVGVVAVAAAMVYKMRNGKKVMLPVMPTGNQQPASALPSPKKSPVVNPIEPKPIVNRPIDRPIYDAPVYTPIVNRPIDRPIYDAPVYTPIVNRPVDRPIYDAPIYDQEYRRGGRGRIGVDEGYRDEAIAGLKGLSYLLR